APGPRSSSPSWSSAGCGSPQLYRAVALSGATTVTHPYQTRSPARTDWPNPRRHVSAPDLPAPTDPNHLGAHLMDDGARFELWAPRATRVELALVDEDRTQHNHDMERRDDGVWSVHVPGVEAEQRYGFRVHGEWDPDDGMRFNPAKLLLDPYARAITAGVDYAGPIRDHPADDRKSVVEAERGARRAERATRGGEE